MIRKERLPEDARYIRNPAARAGVSVGMSDTKKPPVRCADCRFHGDYFCYHDRSGGYDAIGERQFATMLDMRRSGHFERQVCGYDADLFEPFPPETFMDRYGCLVVICVIIIVITVLSRMT